MTDQKSAYAYIVGGGIAGLAAAVYLIRDAGFGGERICILEENATMGGSLDASGMVVPGYLMRGERMFSKYFDCLYDLLSQIPSYDRPGASARDDILEFTREASWNAKTRLLDRYGNTIDVSSMGFDNGDRLALLKLLLHREASLGASTIEQVLPPHFFTTNFWFMWCTMFAFQPWHSAVEMRRYLLHFMYAFPTIRSMTSVHLTRYSQYHSIIAPIEKWLRQRRVRFETSARVIDMVIVPDLGRYQVTALEIQRSAGTEKVALGAKDFVIFTNGSMTGASTTGAMDEPAELNREEPGSSWALWKKIAANRAELGHPDVFVSDVDKSKWLSFTATTTLPLLRDLIEEKTQMTLGRAGLITFRDSNWLMTIKFNYYPVYPGQPRDAVVWWGYGLHPDAEGNFVKKKMADCTGEDLLREAYMHLHFEQNFDELMRHSRAIPCMMPYITSQFMPRVKGDRPDVFPQGSENLAFVGQFCEARDDTVFTVEYSVRTAKMAVNALAGGGEPPPMYKSWRDPQVLYRAMAESLR